MVAHPRTRPQYAETEKKAENELAGRKPAAPKKAPPPAVPRPSPGATRAWKVGLVALGILVYAGVAMLLLFARDDDQRRGNPESDLVADLRTELQLKELQIWELEGQIRELRRELQSTRMPRGVPEPPPIEAPTDVFAYTARDRPSGAIRVAPPPQIWNCLRPSGRGKRPRTD